MEDLSDEQIEEFREAFSLFDPDNRGYIQEKEIESVLSYLGIYITNEEKKKYYLKHDYEQSQEVKISFQDFLKIIVKIIGEIKPEDDLLEAFNLFKEEKSNDININQFKEEFKEYLPDYDENLINDLCQYIKQDSNLINIPEAVQKLTYSLKDIIK